MSYKILKSISISEKNINLETVHEVIWLAVEIAREGREGKKIGTMFVVSDEKETLRKSKSMILDPLAGHPHEKKEIKDFDTRETVKELAQLDGAFIVSDSGVVLSACRYISADPTEVNVPLGLGSRHMAAAAITSSTKSVAVVVSENSVVRVFDNGELISEILLGTWLVNRSSIKSGGKYIEVSESDLTVISRKK